MATKLDKLQYKLNDYYKKLPNDKDLLELVDNIVKYELLIQEETN